jgi:hypothetical protein
VRLEGGWHRPWSKGGGGGLAPGGRATMAARAVKAWWHETGRAAVLVSAGGMGWVSSSVERLNRSVGGWAEI